MTKYELFTNQAHDYNEMTDMQKSDFLHRWEDGATNRRNSDFYDLNPNERAEILEFVDEHSADMNF